MVKLFLVVEISVEKNENSPSYYRGEPLEIMCNYNLSDSSFTDMLSGFGVKVGEGESSITVGCTIDRPPGKSPAVQERLNPDAPLVSSSLDNCEATYEKLRSGDEASLSLTFELEIAAEYRCIVWTVLGNDEQSEALDITTVLGMDSYSPMY